MAIRIRNALTGFIRSEALTLAACKRIVQQAELWMLGREHLVMSARVLELAAESGCMAYDCEFVALAEAAGLQLVTSDRQILRVFRRMQYHQKTLSRDNALTHFHSNIIALPNRPKES